MQRFVRSLRQWTHSPHSGAEERDDVVARARRARRHRRRARRHRHPRGRGRTGRSRTGRRRRRCRGRCGRRRRRRGARAPHPPSARRDRSPGRRGGCRTPRGLRLGFSWREDSPHQGEVLHKTTARAAGPRHSSMDTIAAYPFARACSRGVTPSLSPIDRSAPAATSRRTISWWAGPPLPSTTASSRAVQPRSLT